MRSGTDIIISKVIYFNKRHITKDVVLSNSVRITFSECYFIVRPIIFAGNAICSKNLCEELNFAVHAHLSD